MQKTKAKSCIKVVRFTWARALKEVNLHVEENWSCWQTSLFLVILQQGMETSDKPSGSHLYDVLFKTMIFDPVVGKILIRMYSL